ncbi:MAG: helix-turn-helix domain-containing protein [Phascolarctobacterium sp.]|nr:helix-turn-helix domain-containing protein [Phascolarctobacterium sp.]
MDNDKPVFYNAKEVAEVYFDGKISYRQILAMTRKGTIPGFYEGRCYIYEKTALDQWVKNRLTKTNTKSYTKYKLD